MPWRVCYNGGSRGLSRPWRRQGAGRPEMADNRSGLAGVLAIVGLVLVLVGVALVHELRLDSILGPLVMGLGASVVGAAVATFVADCRRRGIPIGRGIDKGLRRTMERNALTGSPEWRKMIREAREIDAAGSWLAHLLDESDALLEAVSKGCKVRVVVGGENTGRHRDAVEGREGADRHAEYLSCRERWRGLAADHPPKSRDVRGSIAVTVSRFEYPYCTIVRLDDRVYYIPYLCKFVGGKSMLFEIIGHEGSQMFEKYSQEFECLFEHGSDILSDALTTGD